ncbi:MAG: hypothetical protein AAGI48_13590 [Verrucomicrobiota bacterium]
MIIKPLASTPVFWLFAAKLVFSFLLTSCSPVGVLIPSSPGPEDLATFEVDGKTFIVTGTAKRFTRPSKEDLGRIEVLDVSRPHDGFQAWESRKMRANPDASGIQDRWGLIPVGIDSIKDPTIPTRTLLYVVSAGRDEEGRRSDGRVAVYKVGSNGLDAGLSLEPSPYLSAANGLAVAPDGTIFVSNFNNFSFSPDDPKAVVRDLTDKVDRAPGGTVVSMRPGEHGGDGKWRIVAEGFAGANGMAVSPDGSHLLVCSYYGRAIHAFRRSPEGVSLEKLPDPVRSFSFHLDNLKSLGDDEYTVVGQTSIAGGVWHFLTRQPTFPGAGQRFRWTPGAESALIHDYSDSLRKDRCGPSTAIPIKDWIYVGHIASPGVRRLSNLQEASP